MLGGFVIPRTENLNSPTAVVSTSMKLTSKKRSEFEHDSYLMTSLPGSHVTSSLKDMSGASSRCSTSPSKIGNTKSIVNSTVVVAPLV